VDFLGYVILPHVTVIRTNTKKRIFRRIEYAKEEFKKGKIKKEKIGNIIVSYLGVLSHCRSGKLQAKIKRNI